MHFGDRRINRKTDKQMDKPIALSRSCCCERRLNNAGIYSEDAVLWYGVAGIYAIMLRITLYALFFSEHISQFHFCQSYKIKCFKYVFCMFAVLAYVFETMSPLATQRHMTSLKQQVALAKRA